MENTIELLSSCPNDENNNNLDGPKKVIEQFYLVKIQSSFVDSLKSEIEMAEKKRREMEEAKVAISEEIASIKEKLRKEGYKLWGYSYWYSGRREDRGPYLREQMAHWLRVLQRQFPDEANDPNFESKLEAKAKLEPIDFDEKIEEISRRLTHGRRSAAEEKRMLRELKELQTRKEQPDHHDQEAAFQKLDWLAKEALCRLKNLRCQLKREVQAKEQFEQKKAEIEQEIMALEQKKAQINHKKGSVNQRILQLKMKLNDQGAFYDEYIRAFSKTKELAEKKDMVALEELSNKQVEEFMCRWNNDDSFRSNYKTSIIPSLRDRQLSYDARMRNYGERFFPNNS